MKDIVVLILAGGDGGRFWPLSDKNSLPFLGKPLAYHHLYQLHKFGFKNIVVVVNGNNKALFDKSKKEFPDLNIELVLQSGSTQGMAGAILSAKNYIQGKSVLIRNGSDIYEDLLVSSILKELEPDPDAIITGVTHDTYFPGGYLKLKDDNVVGIVEKPPPGKIPSNIVTIVFDYFKNADLLLSAISEITANSDDVFEKGIDLLIKNGLGIKFLPYKGFWKYLKLPWHTLDVCTYYLGRLQGQKIKSAFIDKSAVISGNVVIEDGVKILENTKIVGPAYIGHGTIIGQNCLIRETMIGGNCVVGYSTEIARSFVGDNCWFHTNYVGDSVISSNVALGAGTVCANYKLSEGAIKSFVGGQKVDTGKVKLGSMIGANVRIGINVSVMPGVKIGKNCFVGPAVLLDKDLEDDKSCKLKSAGYEIKPNKIKLPETSRNTILKNLKLS